MPVARYDDWLHVGPPTTTPSAPSLLLEVERGGLGECPVAQDLACLDLESDSRVAKLSLFLPRGAAPTAGPVVQEAVAVVRRARAAGREVYVLSASLVEAEVLVLAFLVRDAGLSVVQALQRRRPCAGEEAATPLALGRELVSQLVRFEVEERGSPSDYRSLAGDGRQEWQYVWLEGDGRTAKAAAAENGRTVTAAQRLACHGAIVEVRHVHREPRIMVAEGLFSPAEAARVQEVALPDLHPSLVVTRDERGVAKSTKFPGRTSHSCRIRATADPVLKALVQRCAFLLGIHPAQAEPLQVIRYEIGQQYVPHFDWFNPKNADYHERTKLRGQRVATAFCYLVDLPENAGGCTTFHKLGPLSVQPRLGRCVLWDNVDRVTGLPDERTLHSGDLVERGVKWAVNIFFRERASNGSEVTTSTPSPRRDSAS